MKTNGFKTGNVLRDLFLQSHLHGYEYQTLICAHFNWSREEFKKRASGVYLFPEEDMETMIKLQKVTLIVRNIRLINYDPNDYDHEIFGPFKP